MSDRVPRGLLARGAPTQSGPTAASIKPSAPIGAVRPPDSGFDEPDYFGNRGHQHGLIIPPNNGRSPFQGGENFSDKAKFGYSRIDSGIYSGDLETSMQSLSLSHSNSRSQPTAHKRRLPLAGQAKVTRIAEMRKNNVSSTVQAPSHRSNNSSLTYSSTQPSYGQYPSNYSSPMHSHYNTPSYPQQPQQQNFVDVRGMLQQNLHLFMQDREGDT